MEKITIPQSFLDLLATNVLITEEIVLELETSLALIDHKSNLSAMELLNTIVNSSGFKKLKENLKEIEEKGKTV